MNSSTENPSASRQGSWPYVAAIALAIVVLLSSYFGSLRLWPASADPDGLQQLSFARSIADSVRNHGQLPLWNPYFGGGIPWQGHIYNPGLSPATLVYVAFGEIIGVKVWIAVLLIFSCWGIYDLLAVGLALTRQAALIGTIIYVSAPWYALRILDGNYDELALFLVPAACALTARLCAGHWSGTLLPLVYVTAFAQAKYAPFIILGASCIFVISGEKDSSGRTLLNLGRCTLAFLVGVGLSLPKLLPLLEMLRQDLVGQGQYAGGVFYDSLGSAWEALTGFAPNKGTVGISPWLLLVAPGAWLHRRSRALAPTLLFAVSLLVCLGPHSPLPLWPLLENMPILRSMNDVVKYFNVLLLLSLTCLVALAFDSISRISRDRLPVRPGLQRLLLLAVGLGLCFPHFLLSTQLFDEHFTQNPETPSQGAFDQVAHLAEYGRIDRYRHSEPSQYRLMIRNLGTITWYGNFVFAENAVPSRFVDPQFRFVRNEAAIPTVQPDTARITRLSYNSIQVETNSTHQGTVTLNFNYDPRWTTPAGVPIVAVSSRSRAGQARSISCDSSIGASGPVSRWQLSVCWPGWSIALRGSGSIILASPSRERSRRPDSSDASLQ